VAVFVQVFLNKIIILYDDNLTKAFVHKSTSPINLVRADRFTAA